MMSAKNISQKLLVDLRASWPKTAMLLGLLGVGFWIWTPMLLKSFGKGTAVRSVKAAASSAPTPPPASPTIDKSSTTNSGSSPSDSLPEVDWPTWEERLARDPLAGKALSTTRTNPFLRSLDDDPILPLFEPEPVAPVMSQNHQTHEDKTPIVEKVAAAPRPALELQSTVVGSERRAALINSRLVIEGKTFTIARTKLRLVHVAPQRVIVEDAHGQFELKLTRSVQLVVGNDIVTDEPPQENNPTLPEL